MEDVDASHISSRVRRQAPTVPTTSNPTIVSTDTTITKTVNGINATVTPEQQKNENRINSKITGSGKLGVSSENEPTSMKKENTTYRDRPLLGVNGTGQRKDMMGTVKPIVVSEPINPQSSNKTTFLLPSWRQGDESPSNLDDELSFDKFDTEDGLTNKTLSTHNVTTYKEDYHIFYNSTTATVDESVINKYWSDLKNLTTSTLLSKSHRRAMVSFFRTFFFIVESIILGSLAKPFTFISSFIQNGCDISVLSRSKRMIAL